MKVSLTSDAEHELTQGALYYAREANIELGQAFLSEFERSVGILLDYPKLGATWRGAEVRVIALAHQRRKPGYWKGRT